MRQHIDGERKALMVGDIFSGLLTRSQWATRRARKGERLVTQRALLGAALHVQALAGQFPPVGTEIPLALFEGRSGIHTTGKAMSAMLEGYATQRKAERAAFKTLASIKAQIV